MDSFFDWSDDAIAPLKPAKTQQAKALAADIEAFIVGGGSIKKVPYNPIPEMVGAVWTTKERHPREEGPTMVPDSE